VGKLTGKVSSVCCQLVNLGECFVKCDNISDINIVLIRVRIKLKNW